MDDTMDLEDRLSMALSEFEGPGLIAGGTAVPGNICKFCVVQALLGPDVPFHSTGEGESAMPTALGKACIEQKIIDVNREHEIDRLIGWFDRFSEQYTPDSLLMLIESCLLDVHPENPVV